MNKSDFKRAGNGSTRQPFQGPRQVPQRPAPAAPAPGGERKQDPRETAQESVHQVTPKDDVPTPVVADADKKA